MKSLSFIPPILVRRAAGKADAVSGRSRLMLVEEVGEDLGELGESDRLLGDVGDVELLAGGEGVGMRAAGHDDDGDFVEALDLAEAAQQLDPAHVREVNVEEEGDESLAQRGGAGLGQQGKGLARVAEKEDVLAERGLAQLMMQQLLIARVVLDYDDAYELGGNGFHPVLQHKNMSIGAGIQESCDEEKVKIARHIFFVTNGNWIASLQFLAGNADA